MKKLLVFSIFFLCFAAVANAKTVHFGQISADCAGCSNLETFIELVSKTLDVKNTAEFARLFERYVRYHGCYGFHEGDMVVIEEYLGDFFVKVRKVKSGTSYWITPIWVKPIY